jgi:hypothetical protein
LRPDDRVAFISAMVSISTFFGHDFWNLWRMRLTRALKSFEIINVDGNDVGVGRSQPQLIP